MKEKRKIDIFYQIQWKLDQKEQPTPRELGLTEKEFRELADGTQFVVEKLEENGNPLDNFVVSKLLRPALVLMAKYPDPTVPIHRNQQSNPSSSWTVWLGRALGKKLWDLAMVALGAVIGWFLKKHFGQ